MLIDGMESELVPASDRGLQYGDGLFETIAVTDGRLQLWRRHMQRLQEGCERLGIAMPADELLLAEAAHLCRDQERAVLKIIVTRGSGGRGYRPTADAQPRRILSLHPWPDYPSHWARDGVVVRLCSTRLGLNPQLAGLKHLNRLEQVLARTEWDDGSIAEGVMQDVEGQLVEGSMSNLFLVRDGVLQTPPVDRCGVAGVMRAHLLALAQRHGLPCEIRTLDVDAMGTADEVFLCNSIIGIWPVRQFEQYSYRPGALTQLLQQFLASREGHEDA